MRARNLCLPSLSTNWHVMRDDHIETRGSGAKSSNETAKSAAPGLSMAQRTMGGLTLTDLAVPACLAFGRGARMEGTVREEAERSC
ncbi:hypothetical protein MPTK1_8g04670 [Marchantia polymorpha subsp. ruderalis]|uniref:Uncharacterized protein n=1 Tax=Marchantia polymorpha TaxID=3197 RepID=A0A2R6W1I6_MARPO|nr:hypothetical protein MARPO_0186s0016 [Marchantia polymorpha]BBN18696.1 hypothetical protein Mp_8g04670 [Marchantia polymorpha subsp. ruderalis]|eukprot:PTQ27717.1 hypothetical protein MARPO_0186s0016 [Marchantia polymorpha]